MPANKYALIRYRVIDRMIGNKYKRYPSIEDLVDGCSDVLGTNVSRSSIEKDIKAMKNDGDLGYNAPIKYSRAEGGYFYEDAEYSINQVPLNEDDITAIRFAAGLLDQFRETSIFNQYEQAIDKVLDKVSISSLDTEAEMLVQFEHLPTVLGNEWLTTLLDCARKRSKILLTYQSYQEEKGRARIVHPYMLKEHANRWYLIALDEEKDRVQVYGLDRIKNIEVLEGSFKTSKSFNRMNFFSHTMGITVFQNEKPEVIELKCNPILTKYLKSQPLHATQKIKSGKNGWSTVQLKVHLTYELIRSILSYGPEVKVVAPLKLKKLVKDKLSETIGLYK